MEIIIQFICPCNNKSYPSKQSLKAHQRTKGHLQWDNEHELRNLKITLTERDNNIVYLNNKVDLLRDLNNKLIDRIKIDNFS